MAGNYSFWCPIDFTDIKTPADFRKNWTEIATKKIPVDEVTRNSVRNLSSSWLDLYQQVELKNCDHLNHIPVFSRSDFGASIPLAPECTLIPFRLNEDEIGVIISTYNDRMTEARFDSCKLFQGKVGNLLGDEDASHVDICIGFRQGHNPYSLCSCESKNQKKNSSRWIHLAPEDCVSSSNML